MKKLLLIGITVLLLASGCNNSTEPASTKINPSLEIPKTDSKPKEQNSNRDSKTIIVPKSNCDPNYSGCVPVASDVDCKGGTGNGPEYTGKTTVIGSDIYELDKDGDGIACERS